MRDFHKLQVWRKSHTLVLEVYSLTKSFPKDELYGLTNQIRRAATSIPTNIAEGCGRDSNPDFLRFLYIAMGSASELEYLLQLANDLEYFNNENYQELNMKTTEIRRMLNSFIYTIRTDRK